MHISVVLRRDELGTGCTAEERHVRLEMGQCVLVLELAVDDMLSEELAMMKWVGTPACRAYKLEHEKLCEN